MIKKFKKNPVEIEAIQFNGNSNKQEIEKFVGKELKSELESETAYLAGKGAPIFSLLIETKEGVMKAMKGDWIIKEPFPTGDRDFYPCKPDIFESTYTEILNNQTTDQKYKFSVSTKVVDNETGKHSSIFMQSDNPDKLGPSLSDFVQAACILVNLEKDELEEVKRMIDEKLKTQL